MDIAKLVLEYLQLLFSWPVVIGALVVYFLKQHGHAVAGILKRVTSLSLPGVVTLETTDYPAETTLPPPPSTPAPPNPLGQLEQDLAGFLWQGTDLNRTLVRIEVEKLWLTVPSNDSPLTPKSQAKTPSQKLHAMKDIHKLNERAIDDFDFLEGMTKDNSRQDLMKAFNKASFLRAYLAYINRINERR